MADAYYSRPEWSYSSMKLILDHGIDYAVAAKRGDLPDLDSKAIDLGQLVHMLILGGEDQFAISPFENFYSKGSKVWRDEQKAAGKHIITLGMFKAADQILKNIENHPLVKQYIFAKCATFEHEMYARTADGVDMKGKADVLIRSDESAMITDLKTTAKFDKFFKTAQSMHYDLQSAVYTLVTASSLELDPALVKFAYCVVETVAPYRVQFMIAGIDFVEAGERKLRTCVDEIIKFGDSEPNFLIEEVRELGDWSL